MCFSAYFVLTFVSTIFVALLKNGLDATFWLKKEVKLVILSDVTVPRTQFYETICTPVTEYQYDTMLSRFNNTMGTAQNF